VNAQMSLNDILTGNHQFFLVSESTLKSSGHPVIVVTAYVRCDKNDKEHCWQHAQLFRQSLDSKNNCPLDIMVKLKPKE
jgi:hypothetical protein